MLGRGLSMVACREALELGTRGRVALGLPLVLVKVHQGLPVLLLTLG